MTDTPCTVTFKLEKKYDIENLLEKKDSNDIDIVHNALHDLVEISSKMTEAELPFIVNPFVAVNEKKKFYNVPTMGLNTKTSGLEPIEEKKAELAKILRKILSVTKEENFYYYDEKTIKDPLTKEKDKYRYTLVKQGNFIFIDRPLVPGTSISGSPKKETIIGIIGEEGEVHLMDCSFSQLSPEIPTNLLNFEVDNDPQPQEDKTNKKLRLENMFVEYWKNKPGNKVTENTKNTKLLSYASKVANNLSFNTPLVNDVNKAIKKFIDTLLKCTTKKEISKKNIDALEKTNLAIRTILSTISASMYGPIQLNQDGGSVPNKNTPIEELIKMNEALDHLIIGDNSSGITTIDNNLKFKVIYPGNNPDSDSIGITWEEKNGQTVFKFIIGKDRELSFMEDAIYVNTKKIDTCHSFYGKYGMYEKMLLAKEYWMEPHKMIPPFVLMSLPVFLKEATLLPAGYSPPQRGSATMNTLENLINFRDENKYHYLRPNAKQSININNSNLSSNSTLQLPNQNNKIGNVKEPTKIPVLQDPTLLNKVEALKKYKDTFIICGGEIYFIPNDIGSAKPLHLNLPTGGDCLKFIDLMQQPHKKEYDKSPIVLSRGGFAYNFDVRALKGDGDAVSTLEKDLIQINKDQQNKSNSLVPINEYSTKIPTEVYIDNEELQFWRRMIYISYLRTIVSNLGKANLADTNNLIDSLFKIAPDPIKMRTKNAAFSREMVIEKAYLKDMAKLFDQVAQTMKNAAIVEYAEDIFELLGNLCSENVPENAFEPMLNKVKKLVDDFYKSMSGIGAKKGFIENIQNVCQNLFSNAKTVSLPEDMAGFDAEDIKNFNELLSLKRGFDAERSSIEKNKILEQIKKFNEKPNYIKKTKKQILEECKESLKKPKNEENKKKKIKIKCKSDSDSSDSDNEENKKKEIKIKCKSKSDSDSSDSDNEEKQKENNKENNFKFFDKNTNPLEINENHFSSYL